MVFGTCYLQLCKKAIYEAVVQPTVRESFLTAVRSRLREDFELLALDYTQDRKVFHMDRLEEVHIYMRDIKTHKTCLTCLLRPPEKVLACGHALCDVCIQYLGTTSPEARRTFSFASCALCGEDNDRTPFSILPATAGVRILSLDGGGVRGIIPLVLLEQLEQHLVGFGLPLHDFFDFVCGTSAGRITCVPA